MINKILGYIILAIGLIIIFGAVFSSYNIFSGSAIVPEIFKSQTTFVKTAQNASNVSDTQKQMQDILQKQIGEMLPKDAIVKILNLTSWSIFAGILILAGGQIAGIGIKLLRN